MFAAIESSALPSDVDRIHAPRMSFGVAASERHAARVFGEGFLFDLDLRGASPLIALFDALAAGSHGVMVERMLRSPGFSEVLALTPARPAPERARDAQPRPRTYLGSGGDHELWGLVLGSHGACWACCDRIRRRHRLRTRMSHARPGPLGAACMRWLEAVVRLTHTGACAFVENDDGERSSVLIVPGDRFMACSRCRPDLLDDEALSLLDPFTGPIRALCSRGPANANANTNANMSRSVVAFAVDERPSSGPRLMSAEYDASRPNAVALAIGGALERHAFVNDAPDHVGVSRRALGSLCLEPEELGLYHPSQLFRVPFPVYDETTPTNWKDVTALASGERRAVLHDGGIQSCGLWTSSASGWGTDVSSELAITKAVLELVEHDAVIVSCLAHAPAEQVDVRAWNTTHDLEVRGCAVRAYLLQNDVPVPVACVVATSRQGSFFGSAAAMDADDALTRALERTLEACARPPLDGGTAECLAFLDGGPVKGQRGRPGRGASLEHLSQALGDAGRHVFWYAANGRAARFARTGRPRASVPMPLVVVRAFVPGLLPIDFGPTAQLRLSGFAARTRALGFGEIPLPLHSPRHPLRARWGPDGP